MKILKLLFASFWSAIPLGLFYAIACGIATFIENDHGSAVAKALIYNTWWFEFLHLYFIVVLIGCFVSSKAWKRKKYASLFFHSSIIVIILGAGVTRYLGFEGVMHIREGSSANSVLSNDAYLNIKISDEGESKNISLKANLLANGGISTTQEVFGKKLSIKTMGISKLSNDKNDNTSLMRLELKYNGDTKLYEIVGGIGTKAQPNQYTLGGRNIVISWGQLDVPLPFEIFLKDFDLQRYPGSMSPSSYASEVEVIDGDTKFPFRIFMNNVLDYSGYRFFQSSYDRDELGTILSVNKDPGKNLTYIGYFILILGSIWLLFDKNGRFSTLATHLKLQRCAGILVAICIGAGVSSYADDGSISRIENIKKHSSEFTSSFSRLLLQDFGGRIKPLDTLAMEYVHKITKKDGFFGLNNMQVFLGMLMYPADWQKVKMIKISTPELKKILGVDESENYVSFLDVISPESGYVLQNYVENANLKKPSQRGKFDKDVIAIDERVNLAFLIYSGQILRIFPDTNGTNTWFHPMEAVQNALSSGNKEVARRIMGILQTYFDGINLGIEKNDWSNAKEALSSIKEYQKEYGGSLVISDSKISSEIFLNKTNLFGYLILPFILLGVALFVVTIVHIFRHIGIRKNVLYWFYGLLCLLAVVDSIALGLRWYVSGHAPWSNAYESMLYVAWATAIGAVVFFRKSALAISSASFFAGIVLFVANLGFMDPQIGNLVPVLKSYWLNIHVSVITASYGFLGLSFVLGLITLFMFLFRKGGRMDMTIKSLSVINEMSMMLGLLMLTVGNFLGGIWANESWGRYWSWDPKETWALVSICVYALILHIRFLRVKRLPYIFACASVFGFFSILMTYFGVNYYLSGMHSYASGDPVPVPVFLYYLVGAIFVLVALAFRGSDLQSWESQK